MKTLLPLILIFLVCIACSKTPDTLVSKFDEKQMDAAIAKAKSSVQDFIDELQAKNADSYSVKAPITDKHGTEHFWVTDVTYKDGAFSGLIGNDPGIVKNVKFGQPWTIKKEDISDWMYIKNEMIHGGFTIEPLLGTFPKEEAEAIRSKLVR